MVGRVANLPSFGIERSVIVRTRIHWFLFTELQQETLEIATARKAVVQAVRLRDVEVPLLAFRTLGHIIFPFSIGLQVILEVLQCVKSFLHYYS